MCCVIFKLAISDKISSVRRCSSMWFKFLIFALTIAIGESQSCSNFFQYVYGTEGIEGAITYHPPVAYEHNLRVILTVSTNLPSVSSNRPY